MSQNKEEKLQAIRDLFEDEIKDVKNNKAPRKFYSWMLKGYVIQYALDFGEHARLAQATGISRLLIKKWVKLSRRKKREKAAQTFTQLKMIYKPPGNLV